MRIYGKKITQMTVSTLCVKSLLSLCKVILLIFFELYSHLLCGSLQSCQVLGSFEKVKLVIRERGSRIKTVGKPSSSKKCSQWPQFPFSWAENLVLHLAIDYTYEEWWRKVKILYFTDPCGYMVNTTQVLPKSPWASMESLRQPWLNGL